VSAPQPAAGRGTTLRATSSAVSFWAAVAIAVVFMGDAAVRGAWSVVAAWLPLTGFVVYLAWLVLYRSSLRVETYRLTVINLARVHTAPWARIMRVAHGPQILLELDDGTTLTCWGGPFPPRPGRESRGQEQSQVQRLLEARCDGAAATDEPVRHRWDVPVLAVGAILAVAAVVAPLMVSG